MHTEVGEKKEEMERKYKQRSLKSVFVLDGRRGTKGKKKRPGGTERVKIKRCAESEAAGDPL